jgi:hypothetical protein
LLSFRSPGLSGGDDPDHLVLLSVAVADDEHAEEGAETKEDESFLVVGVVRIGEQETMFIGKGRGGLLEIDPVLALVRRILSVVPLEAQPGHSTTLTTM